MAQTTADSETLEKLRKDMYYHFSKHNNNEFIETVEALKKVAKALKNEKDYYKAYGNQAVYTSTNISRGQAIDIAKAIYKEAEQEKSYYGLFTANFVLGTIYSALLQHDEARLRYQDAIEILEQHFPEESTAAIYLAICKIERALNHTDKVDEYVKKVLDDSKTSMQHRLNAMSYRCMNLAYMKAPMETRDKAYAEREELKAKYGHDDNFGYIVDFDQAVLHGEFDRAKRIIDQLPDNHKTSKLLYYSKLYYASEDYKTAYIYENKYWYHLDSINSAQIKKTSLDMGMMIDKVQAENEAKSLRLINKQLRMEEMAHELKQKEMQEQALSMKLENEKRRLQESEALRANDSLMAYNKDLRLSEIRSKLEARENEARTERIKWIAAGVLAAIAIFFIAIYANTRRKQLRQLKAAYDKLEETTAAKERIESELRIAREIQMAMVPHEFPSSKSLDIYAQMTPAKEVGGDLYDFVLLDDKLYFCVGDVSGKGVPAALFMSMSARLFRTLCNYSLSPAQIATSMNNELAQNNDNGMFVTMFIGLLNLKSGVLEFCNAGHNPPILDGNFIDMEPNAPIGLWEGLDYEGQTLGDITGMQLFVYSDGLNEAENADNDQYSDERMQDFVRKHHNLGCHQLIDSLEQDVESHVNGAAPSDDLTMLCIRKY
ncbi:MAG: SpoIIE family protein phosphatase [Prevotella sp.]|nr:SpoIIE family protein phosphatase [Prevotella sp.]